ncbi:MAG: hypothetical protein IPK18_12050 [Sphingobacteriales bacterium]|nr:MAG: hypothetical protein IPK18_12050 [Sphingobacteriales bacterium]
MAFTTFLEILKYTLPSTIMLFGVYFIIQSFFDKDNEQKNFELKKLTILENRKITLPLRLQAYERAILFLERIQPFHLVQRLRDGNMSVIEFNLLINQTIRTEFEYNLSQQMYLSNEAWTLLNTAKEETIKQFNSIALQLPSDERSSLLVKAIFDYFSETNKANPAQIAINFLKEDVKKLF